MQLIPPRVKDLGGFSVRRILPWEKRRMVGPFIFFDHMGPAHFKPGQGIDVRPHPHIGLATVTYLFDGAFQHRDSLGSNQRIEPGAVNWMIAGRGVVHSERSPDPDRASGSDLHGIQLWVALPESLEEMPPSFTHHPKTDFPELAIEGVTVKVLLGELFGRKSPVRVLSPLFYAEAKLSKAQGLDFNPGAQEAAIYVVSGSVTVDRESVEAGTMVVLSSASARIDSASGAHVMLLGGAHIGPRFIDWNFVSSSKERLAEAVSLWRAGPTLENPRFTPIPGDQQEFIPRP
jgi:redox-sensitive bicupin YhaK (pirin superfamily)